MTIEKFLKPLNQDINITNLGYIHNKYLAKVFKLYKYIDVTEYWYDDEDNPGKNTWIDIEGMGYGWLWLNCKSNKILRKKLQSYLCLRKNEPIYTFKYNDVKYYLFSLGDEIVQIRASNKELSPLRD